VFLRNSISVPLRLPPSLLLCFSAARSRCSSRPCVPPPPPQRRPAPGHVPFPASPLPSPTTRWPPLPSPRRTCRLPEPSFTAARRRCNPAPPPASRRPHVLLSGRPPPQLSPLSSSLRATLPPASARTTPWPPCTPPTVGSGSRVTMS
jgi:hypothetical protein